VFILSGVVLGLVAGFLLGGRLGGLATVRFRLGWLAIVALAIQVILFSALGDGLAADVRRVIYVGSTALVGIVVLANLRLTGVPLVALGAALNLAAILANGGSMPADPAALASLGMTAEGNTNSVVLAAPALAPLTDVFAMPAWMPFSNVFSVGDVLIGIGVAVAIAAAMRSDRRPVAPR
jgi:uncharacterized protein DUF5317